MTKPADAAWPIKVALPGTDANGKPVLITARMKANGDLEPTEITVPLSSAADDPASE